MGTPESSSDPNWLYSCRDYDDYHAVVGNANCPSFLRIETPSQNYYVKPRCETCNADDGSCYETGCTPQSFCNMMTTTYSHLESHDGITWQEPFTAGNPPWCAFTEFDIMLINKGPGYVNFVITSDDTTRWKYMIKSDATPAGKGLMVEHAHAVYDGPGATCDGPTHTAPSLCPAEPAGGGAGGGSSGPRPGGVFVLGNKGDDGGCDLTQYSGSQASGTHCGTYDALLGPQYSGSIGNKCSNTRKRRWTCAEEGVKAFSDQLVDYFTVLYDDTSIGDYTRYIGAGTPDFTSYADRFACSTDMWGPDAAFSPPNGGCTWAWGPLEVQFMCVHPEHLPKWGSVPRTHKTKTIQILHMGGDSSKQFKITFHSDTLLHFKFPGGSSFNHNLNSINGWRTYGPITLNGQLCISKAFEKYVRDTAVGDGLGAFENDFNAAEHTVRIAFGGPTCCPNNFNFYMSPPGCTTAISQGTNCYKFLNGLENRGLRSDFTSIPMDKTAYGEPGFTGEQVCLGTKGGLPQTSVCPAWTDLAMEVNDHMEPPQLDGIVTHFGWLKDMVVNFPPPPPPPVTPPPVLCVNRIDGTTNAGGTSQFDTPIPLTTTYSAYGSVPGCYYDSGWRYEMSSPVYFHHEVAQVTCPTGDMTTDIAPVIPTDGSPFAIEVTFACTHETMELTGDGTFYLFDMEFNTGEYLRGSVKQTGQVYSGICIEYNNAGVGRSSSDVVGDISNICNGEVQTIRFVKEFSHGEKTEGVYVYWNNVRHDHGLAEQANSGITYFDRREAIISSTATLSHFCLGRDNGGSADDDFVGVIYSFKVGTSKTELMNGDTRCGSPGTDTTNHYAHLGCQQHNYVAHGPTNVPLRSDVSGETYNFELWRRNADGSVADKLDCQPGTDVSLGITTPNQFAPRQWRSVVDEKVTIELDVSGSTCNIVGNTHPVDIMYQFTEIPNVKQNVIGDPVTVGENPGLDENLEEQCGRTELECCQECQYLADLKNGCQGFFYDPTGCTDGSGESTCIFQRVGTVNVDTVGVSANIVAQPAVLGLKIFRLADRPPSAPPPSPPPLPPPSFTISVDGSDPQPEKGILHDTPYTVKFTGEDGPKQGDWIVWVRKDYDHLDDPSTGSACEGAGAIAANDAAQLVAQQNET